ncbi:bacteriocin immunity protein [Pantoea sp. Tr-811]|uniref:bacteriocin immunity protein n=1 Tax=Pantoea sp. Tr-811 TaxID=2608361 RepID=UPI0014246663|nr:bacteriocin immunity protein [Pantoea sp. Tr-811]NIF26012.1 bacteriocin immunity protein [Pantoea sp. Tr-811]
MKDKKNISDFTENEFLKLIISIADPADDVSEKELDARILDFKEISEHPSGSDLIYWPEADGLDTPEEILRIVKEWRAAKQLPGFKAS